ncbi:MAG: hypothetical protein JW833_13520 [Prolixibacteraceae bacterium]|nr:hypothetical protein [Prolixibacteraceae bacterium]
MRQVITFAVLILLAACNTLEFETPVGDSVMSAYIGSDFWAADSLSEAYYFKNTLYISAKGDNEDIILKIENPVIGENLNVDFAFLGKKSATVKNENGANIKVVLNLLDTANAQPSIVSGAFYGDFISTEGDFVDIKEGKINNAVTENLFCENDIRSYSVDNADIGGQWELVRVVSKKDGSIQNPTCKNKVYLNFYNENYQVDKIEKCDCNFEITGPGNSLWGNFELLNETQIEFFNQEKSVNTTTLYNEFLENLVFECITTSNSCYINNTLMHLESPGFIGVFYRRS